MNHPDNPYRLEDKVALVTGAGRGIGASIARTLARAGAKVMLTDIVGDSARAMAAQIVEAGGQADWLQHDVSSEAEWEATVATTVSRLGGLDVLVNNAGVEIMRLITDMTQEEFRQLLAVNVEGVFLGLKHGIRAMRPGGSAGKGGSIVNLSSVGGMIGFTGLSGYCATKGAVRLLSKAAAVECGQLQTGIRVNSVHPGIVKTDMGMSVIQGIVNLGLVADLATAETMMQGLHPIGTGEPDNVADAVLYLASDASRWTTGAEHVVDGGLSAM